LKDDPKHVEEDCPQYKHCGWCTQSGSYGFLAKHKCQILTDDNMDYGDNRDENLWATYD